MRSQRVAAFVLAAWLVDEVPASARVVVNGSFASGFAGEAGFLLEGDSVNIGADGVCVDDGWILEEDPDAAQWVVTSGTARREDTSETPNSAVGFGQIVTCPFPAGSRVYVQFDYEFNSADEDDGLAYVLVGFDFTGNFDSDPDNWLGSRGDSIDLFEAGGAADFLNANTNDIGGTLPSNYDRYRIDSLLVTNDTSGVRTYLAEAVLTNDFEYLGIAFAGGVGDGGDFITVGNVSIAAANLAADGSFTGDRWFPDGTAQDRISGDLVDLDGDGDGDSIDDGWAYFYNQFNAPYTGWVVNASGRARRDNTLTVPARQAGFGQLLSNPGDGTFDSGDVVTVTFDYAYVGSDGQGFMYAFWAFDNTGAGTPPNPEDFLENDANLDCIRLFTGATAVPLVDATGVGNYDVFVLDSISNAVTASGAHTADITLTRDYEYFGISFYAMTDDPGDYAEVWNVSITGGVFEEFGIPLLGGWGLAVLAGLIGGVGWRRFRRMR